MKKIIYLVCAFILAWGCTREPHLKDADRPVAETALSVDEAKAFFESQAGQFPATRAGEKPRAFAPGEFTPQWDMAEGSQNSLIASVDIPIMAQYRYRALRTHSNNGQAEAYEVMITQKLIVVKGKANGKEVLSQYIMTLIPDKAYYARHKNDMGEQFLNSGDKGRFSGIVLYTIPGLEIPVQVCKYEQGVKTQEVLTLTTQKDSKLRIAQAREMIGVLQLGHTNSMQTRNGEDDMPYDWTQDDEDYQDGYWDFGDNYVYDEKAGWWTYTDSDGNTHIAVDNDGDKIPDSFLADDVVVYPDPTPPTSPTPTDPSDPNPEPETPTPEPEPVGGGETTPEPEKVLCQYGHCDITKGQACKCCKTCQGPCLCPNKKCHHDPCRCPKEVDCDSLAHKQIDKTQAQLILKLFDLKIKAFISMLRGDGTEFNMFVKNNLNGGPKATDPKMGTVGGVSGKIDANTIAGMHNHDSGNPPSDDDIWALIYGNSEQGGNFTDAFMYTPSGDIYCIHISNGMEAFNFYYGVLSTGSTPPPGKNFDPMTSSIWVNFYNCFANAYQELKGLNYNYSVTDAGYFAWQYALSQHKLGVTIMKKNAQENGFQGVEVTGQGGTPGRPALFETKKCKE